MGTFLFWWEEPDSIFRQWCGILILRKMKQVRYPGRAGSSWQKRKGSTWLHEELRKVDPESAEAIHENNVKRVIRALEFYQLYREKDF